MSTLFSQPVTRHMSRSISSLVSSKHIIHLHSPNPLAEHSILKLYKKSTLTSPLIITVHCDIKKNFLLKNIYLEQVLKPLLRRAQFITVSAPQNKNLPQLKDFDLKTQVIPFGSPIKTSFQTPLSNKKKYLLFVGRLVKYKGLQYLLKALQNSSYQLKIAGDGPLKTKLQKLSKTLNLSSQVDFLGFQYGSNLDKLYEQAFAVVLPSIDNSEAFGMNLIEGLCFGTPLITTEVGSGTSFVNIHNKTGLIVPPENSPALRSALDTLHSNPSLHQQFSLNARLHFKENFTLDQMALSYAKLFKESQKYIGYAHECLL